MANVEASTVTRCETLGVALERAYRDATLPSGGRGSVAFSSWSLD